MIENPQKPVHGSNQHWSVSVLRISIAALILRVVVSIVSRYRDYLPPDFESDFLLGRSAYFFGTYRWAFYTHITSGPVTLILGLILISNRFRVKWPAWHRRLGRWQILTVLLLVAPSGLWMSFSAQSGAVAGLGFGSLAIMTAYSAMAGWRLAVKRRFEQHRIWMWRCFLMLNSAVILRLSAGLAEVLGMESDWIYPLNAWLCWLLPLALFEITLSSRRVMWASELTVR